MLEDETLGAEVENQAGDDDPSAAKRDEGDHAWEITDLTSQSIGLGVPDWDHSTSCLSLAASHCPLCLALCLLSTLPPCF